MFKTFSFLNTEYSGVWDFVCECTATHNDIMTSQVGGMDIKAKLIIDCRFFEVLNSGRLLRNLIFKLKIFSQLYPVKTAQSSSQYPVVTPEALLELPVRPQQISPCPGREPCTQGFLSLLLFNMICSLGLRAMKPSK